VDTPPPPDDPKDLFLQNLELIERIAEQACRRSRLRPEDKEDFVAWVKLKLVDHDYAVIRQFEARANATFRTFLTVVINRLVHDYRDHLWGKWRNSAEAIRLGPVAERLERLIHREGYHLDEACQILRTNDKIELSVVEIEDLRAKLPPRTPRQTVGEEVLRFEPTRELPPDQQLEEKDLDRERRRICIALHRALDTLPPDDRLLIQMTGKFKVSEIARLQKIEQKPLYRRLEKIKKALRKAMKRLGVRREDIQKILGCIKKKRDDEDDEDVG
jgi:RNA polymerase sigma factor (sigma-70 family)